MSSKACRVTEIFARDLLSYYYNLMSTRCQVRSLCNGYNLTLFQYQVKVNIDAQMHRRLKRTRHVK